MTFDADSAETAAAAGGGAASADGADGAQRAPGFAERARALIRAIPPGRVASYGQIAALAGNPRGARQVVWALNAARTAGDLPWQRLVNRDGAVALPPGEGFELQCSLLRAEGLPVDERGRIARDGASAFAEFRWDGRA